MLPSWSFNLYGAAITDREQLSVLEVELDMAYSALFPLFPQGFYGFNEADVDTGGYELHVERNKHAGGSTVPCRLSL